MDISNAHGGPGSLPGPRLSEGRKRQTSRRTLRSRNGRLSQRRHARNTRRVATTSSQVETGMESNPSPAERRQSSSAAAAPIDRARQRRRGTDRVSESNPTSHIFSHLSTSDQT